MSCVYKGIDCVMCAKVLTVCHMCATVLTVCDVCKGIDCESYVQRY